MLRNFDNRLNADVIRCLRAMGHGDDLVISDTNFPADSVARHTVTGELLRMDNLTAAEAIDAILSVMPLDDFIPEPVARMQVVGDPGKLLPMQAEVHAIARDCEGRDVGMEALERFAFYEAAKKGFCVVRTSEFRPYGCFLFTMGVIFDRR